MKKKNFITLVLAVVGGLLFGLGMCMCLLPEWDAFAPGVAAAALGAVVLLALVLIRRKMDGKPAVKLNVKTVGIVLYAALSVLVFGAGMCLVMVWDMLPWGIAAGIAGIVLLLGLIPMCRGLK